MANNAKPKPLTFVILLIGGFGLLLLSIGCILDWIKKITLNVDYLINVLYHPLSSVLSITCFFLLIILLLEKASPGRIGKIMDSLKEKKQVSLLFIAITLISLVLLIINSLVLLSETEAGASSVDVLTVVHALLGVLFGVSIMISAFKIILSPYLANPGKWQKYTVISTFIIFIVMLVLVIIGMVVGWIIL